MIIQEHVPLADKNWFKTGGSARFFAEPKNAQEFNHALQFAHQNELNIFILGSGANILISDEGFNGLVIRPNSTTIDICYQNEDYAHVQAGAGATIDSLIEFCLAQNLTNLEEFSGIPGTVGGSVFINLHYYEFLLEQFLVKATLINKTTGELINVDPAWFEFGYDQSKLQQEEYFLIDATFITKKRSDIDTAFAKGRRIEIIRHRQRRYPTHATCGSFFRNFHPHEVEKTSKKLIYVAYYLDKLGVKGELSFGGAYVSHQHANMLINKNNATSSDIIQLAKTMQEMVQKDFGIKPQAECQLVGFKNNPLV